MSAKTNERIKGRVGPVWGKWERGKDFGKWVTCGKYWRIRELKKQKGIAKCNWELKKMVQIVGNLEWELLKNVEIRKSIYTNTRFVDPVYENFAYIKKNHIFSLLETAPYTRRHCTKSTLIVWYFVLNKHYFIEQKRGKKKYMIFLVLGKLFKRWIP